MLSGASRFQDALNDRATFKALGDSKMRWFLATIFCLLSMVAGRGFADDVQPIFDQLDAIQARCDHLRVSLHFVQPFAPSDAAYCSGLCDEIDQRVALCEFMINRAKENGLDPTAQPDIVQQYQSVHQLFAQLQQADAQLSRQYPH